MQVQNIQSTNFQRGLTPQMAKEIASVNTIEISSEFIKNGIPTYFGNNKLIAWCSLKVFQIIQELNKKYNLNLVSPKGIFIDKFENMTVDAKNAFGFTTGTLCRLYKNNDTIFDINTIFFKDKTYSPESFDEFTNWLAFQELSPSDFFLTPILHEFAHVIHDDNMFKVLGDEKYIDKQVTKNKLKTKHKEIISENLCYYATRDPMEAIACDISNRIVNNIDETTLKPIRNPFEKSPYDKSRLFEPRLNKILRRYWNGKF